MKKSLAAALLFLGFATCAWANTIWTVNASFTYPSAGTTNTATGTFTLDSSLNVVTWNITVAGTNVQANNTYTPGNSSLITTYFDTTHVDFYDVSTNQYVDLYLASPLSNAGGTITLLAGDDGADQNSTVVCPGCGVLDHGTVKGATVTPEPSSVLITNYFANDATSGAPAATLRFTQHGSVAEDECAMIYVYDAQQEPIECCGCHVTANGLQTINVNAQLLANPLFGPGSTPSNGVIQIVSGTPTSGGIVGPIGNNDPACDPANVNVAPEIDSWLTHVQNKVGTTFSITETKGNEELLGPTELGQLESDCTFIERRASGHGVCDCGAFEALK